MKYKGSFIQVDKTHGDVTSYTDKTATTVEINVHLGDVLYGATGSAFRVAGDKYTDKGDKLALYRALLQMTSMLETEVFNMSDTDDQ